MLGHNTCAATQNDPCEQRADEGIAQAYPCRGKAEVPTELTRVADKDNGREI